VLLRAQVGMVFQKPNPFPKSIFENVAYGPKLHGLARDKYDLEEIVENSLRKAGLWDEVKDRLNQPGTGLSGGQQQRVSIARALMNGGDVILADEPTGALDKNSGVEVMRILRELNAKGHTIILVTHDLNVTKNATRIIEISDGNIISDRANVPENADSDLEHQTLQRTPQKKTST